jgi:hypothetical protein
MNSNAPAVAARDRINHVKVVALALLASLIIMLIGITARATDDVNGYGVQIGQTLSTNGPTLMR